ncbi:Citryl-CoA lyase [Syntrophobotulus glycolicus DSM 8271]|uniref:Citryl-CoA lyase n=1 Tax=Syntrophobotulus glycolicus (strain DSM 8271 / FlGlyR) TaxID=645991 RepID=F0T1S0_SYNGF|nr:CoA ester lyase [Syntrophobotulus glycolicus]ADY57494.1 Citryl-CoA lyase [Syntrophobotulus glycolicus DSM 8271]
MRGYRRSILFVSGNNPKMLQDAPVFSSDGVVFDLESAVPTEDKDSARLLVKEALTFLDYSKVDIIVKINPLTTKHGINDIEMIAKEKPFAFMIPRASQEQMHEIDKKLTCIENKEGFVQGSIRLIPVIETAYALEYVTNIITSTPRITGAYLNAEGLTADFGMKRTKEGEEIIYARSRVVMACRAQKQNVIDTPFLDGDDYEGLQKDALRARNMGFTGKAAIDGRQIDIIHDIFE